jgi:hypothetical protein
VTACGAPSSQSGGEDTSSDALTLPQGLPIVGAVASTSDSNIARYAIDGDLSTRWAGQGPGASITFELASRSTLRGIAIAWYQATHRKETFEVQVSDDGVSFTTAIARRQSSQSVSVETYDLGGTIATYVRVVGYGNTQNNWNSIREARVVGTPFVDAGAPPSDAGSVTPDAGPPHDGGASPDATADVSAGETDAGPTGDVPGKILDLSTWYLTLPTPLGSTSGNPDTVLYSYPGKSATPALQIYSDPYFHVTSDHTGVLFTAPVNGATTSNSSYPRSELRECNSDGSHASWSSASGTNILTVTGATTQLPPVKPQVVIGQIHDASNDVIEILADGKLATPQGTVGIGYRFNGAEQPTHLDDAYVLGTKYTYRIVAAGGQIQIFYQAPGSSTLKLIATESHSASGLYFKAGAYTQSNLSKGDVPPAAGAAVIYALSVSH